jgi:MbtH protein
MTDPFERTDVTYVVLGNDEGQHCLWPAAFEVPQGWTVMSGPADRGACLDYVNTHWSDLRPRSFVRRHIG